MKVIISTESNSIEKKKLGEFDEANYAAPFVEAMLNIAKSKKEYIKLVVELVEED